MKVLTVKQPWAWLILHGEKDIENRSWPTNVRGRVGIHASSRVDERECRRALLHMATRGLRHADRERWRWEDAGLLVPGAILGTVEVVDCVTSSNSPWFVGEYGFVLRNPVPFTYPIPVRGKLNWWDVDFGWGCPLRDGLYAIVVRYFDECANRMLTLGGGAWLTLGECERALSELPEGLSTSAFLADGMLPNGDIYCDRSLDAATVERVLGRPVAELLAAAKEN